jgi:hypothetical protein
VIGEGGTQSLTVRTATGEKLGDIPNDALTSMTWTRELTEVSRCEFTFATADRELRALSESMWQWQWVTVWDGIWPVWTGPIQTLDLEHEQTKVTCRDVSTFMWRTRIQTTKSWTSTDPHKIAAELWEPMLDLHRVKVAPVVLPGLSDRFSYAVKADSRKVNQAMDDLVKFGLQWTVIAGTPVFGFQPTGQVGDTLSENDFLEAITRRRDGTDTFNDVRLQGKNYASTQVVDLQGLRLQDLVSLDDVSGVANITAAARQYAQRSARLKDSLVIPPGASLHPECPLALSDLVPGAHFGVYAQNVGNVMRLESMSCVSAPGSYDVQVTHEAVPEPGAPKGVSL